jgi:hypothetical protein
MVGQPLPALFYPQIRQGVVDTPLDQARLPDPCPGGNTREQDVQRWESALNKFGLCKDGIPYTIIALSAPP